MTVCRQWQAAFEPLIYSKLSVAPMNFRAITSGSGQSSRLWIHQLTYHIVVPVDLPNWQTRKEKSYSIDNPVREENNAFQSAIIDIFVTLASWNEGLHHSLDLMLLGRGAGVEEPLTYDFDIAGEYRWDFKRGRTKAVPVYRAQFVGDNASFLPDVSCIDRPSFPTISKQQAVSDGLELIPSSLINFSSQVELPWKDIVPGLNLTLSLRELTLEHVSLAPDFLFPLNQDSHPLSRGTSVYCPYLKRLDLGHMPPIQPSSKWLLHPTPEGQAEIDAIEDWEEIICDIKAGIIDRPVFETDRFHRVLISLDYAAHRMPRLRSMRYDLDHSPRFLFTFKTRNDAGRATWSLKSPYRPDQGVVAAWGVRWWSWMRTWRQTI
ncbi:hypothetical protein BDV12DRAFT_210499 [Aspergillus spectabilis]